jgi:hypothetical protein
VITTACALLTDATISLFVLRLALGDRWRPDHYAVPRAPAMDSRLLDGIDPDDLYDGYYPDDDLEQA